MLGKWIEKKNRLTSFLFDRVRMYEYDSTLAGNIPTKSIVFLEIQYRRLTLLSIIQFLDLKHSNCECSVRLNGLGQSSTTWTTLALFVLFEVQLGRAGKSITPTKYFQIKKSQYTSINVSELHFWFWFWRRFEGSKLLKCSVMSIMKALGNNVEIYLIIEDTANTIRLYLLRYLYALINFRRA